MIEKRPISLKVINYKDENFVYGGKKGGEDDGENDCENVGEDGSEDGYEDNGEVSGQDGGEVVGRYSEMIDFKLCEGF